MASDNAHSLAILLTSIPVSIVAWTLRSRSVFVLGLFGTLCGTAFLVPSVTVDYGGDATEYDRILDGAMFDLQGAIPGAIFGVVLAWLGTRPSRKPLGDPELNTLGD